jgi:putative ABC transport system permease protein
MEDFSATEWRGFTLTGDGEPEKVMAYGVTANFFTLLGIKPVLGRTFLLAEDKPGANNVAVISHGLWQGRFGGERNIIGRDILLDNEKFNVIGVMPAGFQFLESYIDLWVPIALSQEELANRGSHYLTVIARIKSGVTFEQANTEIQTIQQRIARDYPAARRIGAYLLPLREQLTGDVQRPLIVLMVAVGFVLLIACANIANLLLSRAATRSREIAIRNALGASRLRILRQLLTECLMLSVAGAGIGLLLAMWSFDFLGKMIPSEMILSTQLKIDLSVLGYTIIISLITGVIFGLVPALRATRVDLNEALKQAGGRTGLGTGNRRLRAALVVGEVSLAIVLLVGAGLLIQTFYKLLDQYSGFRPDNLLTLRTALPMKTYEEHARRVSFYDQVLERVKGLPGVVAAGYTTSVPLAWKGGTSGFVIEGRSVQEMIAMGLSFDANHRQVSSDYLKTMNIPLRHGRYLNESDSINSMPVVVINETMARQYWPSVEALGKRFKLGDPDSQSPWMTIAGIEADHPQMGLDVSVKAEMYMPYRQVATHPWFAPRDLAIRTTVDPKSIVSAVRREVFAVDPNQPISSVDTMGELLETETGNRRIGMESCPTSSLSRQPRSV